LNPSRKLSTGTGQVQVAAQAKLGTPPAGTKLKVKGNEAGGLDYRMYDDSLNG